MIDVFIKKGIRRTKVTLYDEIDQMPVDRFNKVNKYWMLDDSIGSTIADFDKNHYSKMLVLIDDRDKLVKQLENFRILVFNIMNEIDVNSLSFACLIYAVNDVEFTDLSETSLKAMIKKLSDAGLTAEMLKKKSMKSKEKFLMN